MRLREQYEKQEILVDKLIVKKNKVRSCLGRLIHEAVNNPNSNLKKEIEDVEVEFEFLLTRISKERDKLLSLGSLLLSSEELEKLYC